MAACALVNRRPPRPNKKGRKVSPPGLFFEYLDGWPDTEVNSVSSNALGFAAASAGPVPDSGPEVADPRTGL